MAALELWSGDMTARCLLLLAEGGMPPRLLLSTRRSAAGWAAVKKSERMMPAIKSTAWLSPWR